jgi:endonuclease/exonuclease/phosphatase family metal-dependent hydrolase
VFGSIIGGNRKWGSAIVSQKYELEPIELKINSHPGALITARLRLGQKLELQLISVYGIMLDRYAVTSVHRMLSDLTPLIDNYARKNIILAGDFNASLQVDVRNKNKSNQILFDRIQDFGFSDCLAPFQPYPVQTWRSLNDNKLWQLDYLYASKSLFAKLKSCFVIDNPSVRAFSDHNPVVAAFDV